MSRTTVRPSSGQPGLCPCSISAGPRSAHLLHRSVQCRLPRTVLWGEWMDAWDAAPTTVRCHPLSGRDPGNDPRKGLHPWSWGCVLLSCLPLGQRILEHLGLWTEAVRSSPTDYSPTDLLPFLRQRLLKIKCTHGSL